MKRIFISGGVSIDPDYMEKFAQAEEFLSVEFDDYVVVNPARIMAELPPDTEYAQFIKIGLSLLDTCEEIYMLSDWKSSQGAQLEYQYAKCMGISIRFQKEENYD